MSLIQTLTEIEYPESDGKPMGETDVHRLWMSRIYDLLSYRYRGQRVYVGCDLLVYFVRGKPRRFVVPDVFVVQDCDPGLRRTFKIWDEQRVPDVVIEVTSRKTWREDHGRKPKTYARIGVKELFLYDPTHEYLEPPLQGFRFEKGRRMPLTPEASDALESRALGLLLGLEQGRLVMHDAQTGERLLTEAEAERARAEKAQARSEKAQARVQAERLAREAAEVRAAEEARARQAAEDELRRLREELARSRPSDG